MLIVSFPLMEYSLALSLQERVHSLRKKGVIEDCLLLLEHPPTITIGKNGNQINVLFSNELLNTLGVAVFTVGRGGDVTYHGPGQLVGYPILDIRTYAKGVKDFIFMVEEIFIHWLRNCYSIEANHDSQYTGVWVHDKKITAIGFQISRFISMHGFALNINTDLEHFHWINPCGILDKGVTSLQQLTGKPHQRNCIENEIIESINALFHININKLSPEDFLTYIDKKESL